MLSKHCIKFWMVTLAAITLSACGLIPGSGTDTMTSVEKSVLFTQLGSRYLELDMLDVAKEKLKIALSFDSTNAETHNVFGEFYERIREYDLAESSYKSAVRYAPENYLIKGNYGRFLCNRDDYTKGEALLQQALELPMNNRQWFAYTGLGICYLRQNDLAQAESNFRLALQINAEYAPALAEMQKLSYQNRQYMSARAFMERYLAVASHSPETLWTAFQTERALGNSALADDYGTELVKTFPSSKEAQEIKTVIGK